uniref:non-specific serine/threonine protein kinase n=1 Tax=Psilocybe cubensis TaxID=181762 RepID=A0A8H7XRT1_PSICU
MTTSYAESSSQALISIPSTQHRPHFERGRHSNSHFSGNHHIHTVTAQELWQPILHSSNQVVLYNPRSHALSVASAAASEELASGVVVASRMRREEISNNTRLITNACPYCKQSLPAGFSGYPSSTTHPEASLGQESGIRENEDAWGYINTSDEDDEDSGEVQAVSTDPAYHSRASDYFRLLAIANETASVTSGSRRPSISPSHNQGNHEGEERRRPRERSRTPDNRSTKGAFPAEKMAQGYFKTFFQEEYKLGMGASGSVFLCQHVLDGNPLGHFAVKKIAVGESHSYLLKILREVRLLERLHHPNIITYHHAWLENSQFSSFGPTVPTLHVLMQWAEGGSLDDFIDVRLGRKPAHIHMHPLLSSTSSVFTPSVPPSPASSNNELPGGEVPTTPTPTAASFKHTRFATESPGAEPRHSPSKPEDAQSRAARIQAFRAYQRAPPEEKERMRREMENVFGTGPGEGPAGTAKTQWTAVHLLSAQEVTSLFRDVTEGLAFLHGKSILHLDLKPGNVLLTWDEGKLIPRAMLSDFGTSRDMINSSRVPRSGNTGTLEYTAPESLPSPETGMLRQIDSKADMWSLGMILHKLLFFKLPYRYASVGDANGEPISREDEGGKMERLEKEVQEYPGFKSVPSMVTGFENRRLPRAFLVLLENLLHKTPVGRPSVERVVTAIREGKLDPLAEIPSQNLPLARPRGELSVSSASGAPDTIKNEDYSEPTRVLALPSPVEVLGPEETSLRNWLTWKMWKPLLTGVFFPVKKGRRSKKGVPAGKNWHHSRNRLGLRLIRSSLLVVKVLTISRVCLNPATRPRPVVVALLLVAAVSDTVIDHEDEGTERQLRTGSRVRGVWVTVGLALLHFGILGLSAWSEWGGVDHFYAWKRICCIPMAGTSRGPLQHSELA